MRLLGMSVLPAAGLLVATHVMAQPGPPCGPATHHIRLTVTDQRKPASDVLVQVFSDKEIGSFSTGSDGTLELRQLPTGHVVISVLGQDRGRGHACLEVPSSDNGGTGFVTVFLKIPSQLTTWKSGNRTAGMPEICDTVACLSPINLRLKRFAGVATDPTGVGIPTTQIIILRKGGKNEISKIVADARGQFFAHLRSGEYVGFLNASGFRTEIVPFAISSSGKNEAHIKLLVGAATEATAIAN